MGQAISYSFRERLSMSQNTTQGEIVETILLDNIPGACHAYQAHANNDRAGTDWWVELENGAHLAVDIKLRSEDYIEKGRDDLALETWSVVEAKKIGWTRDKRKRTDYILWLWADTGRWCLLPFALLCTVFTENLERWSKLYKPFRQHTTEGNYHSECIFVPRHEVWKEIYLRYSGVRVVQ